MLSSWSSQVLIFCVEFLELSYLTRDLSQAEKKITVFTSWATDKMTTIFTQNYNFDHFEWNRCHFVHLLSLLTTFLLFSAWDRSRVKRDNSQNSTQNIAIKFIWREKSQISAKSKQNCFFLLSCGDINWTRSQLYKFQSQIFVGFDVRSAISHFE